jgi:hypothetical protein
MNALLAILLALQDDYAAYQTSAPELSVLLMSIVIGVVVVCLLLVGVLSFSERGEKGPRTRA